MDRKKFWEWMETCPTKDWIIVEEYSSDNPSDNDYYNYDYVDISFVIKEGDGNDWEKSDGQIL